MPHEVDGTKAVYARTPAWHRIGTVFEDQDVFTAEQALAILNPTDELVRQGRVFVEFVDKDGKKHTVEAEDKAGVADYDHETDSWRIVSVNSKDYGVVQLQDVFRFMDEVIGQIDGAHYEAAVKLRGGKQVCLTADLGEFVLDPGGRADRNLRKLWGFNSHDYSWAFRCKRGNFRVECANMAAMALRGSSDKVVNGDWSTRHTQNIADRIAEAQAALGLYRVYEAISEAQAEHMIQVEINDNTFTRVIEGLFEIDNVEAGTKERNEEAITKVRTIYELGPASQDVFGTVWGAFNAVTEYHDWQTTVRGTGKTSLSEARFTRQIDDQGNLKQRAWDAFWTVAEDTRKFKAPSLA